MNKRNVRNALGVFVMALSVFLIANIDVSIRQGVDGKYRSLHMPLYVKWTQFLARHYEYARLGAEITKSCKTEEEKVLAVLNWTRQNIKDAPDGFPMVDDHILTIIVKGYGNPAQAQDVFTTLCSYAGIPSFWRSVYGGTNRSKYYLSFARINGKWCVFDAHYGVYFKNIDGSIASVEDAVSNKSAIISYDMRLMEKEGLPYMDYYTNLMPVVKPWISRPEKQMPMKRLVYEGAKLFRFVREEDDL